jgi:hypothetical protein
MVNRLFGSTAEVCPVNSDQDQHRRNRLLAALRPRDYALLEPHLQIVPIGEGEFLHLPRSLPVALVKKTRLGCQRTLGARDRHPHWPKPRAGSVSRAAAKRQRAV